MGFRTRVLISTRLVLFAGDRKGRRQIRREVDRRGNKPARRSLEFPGDPLTGPRRLRRRMRAARAGRRPDRVLDPRAPAPALAAPAPAAAGAIARGRAGPRAGVVRARLAGAARMDAGRAIPDVAVPDREQRGAGP